MKWRLLLVAIAVGTFAADLGIQSWVASHMVPGESLNVVGSVLAITYVLNSGAAFGILSHRDAIFIVVALVLLAGVAWVTITRPTLRTILVWGLGLLAGGAAGNLWDRMVAGQVVDYINFHIWPVFNLADSAIVVGMALIFYDYWRKEQAHVPTGSESPREPGRAPNRRNRR